MANGDTLFYYINPSIQIWKTSANFIRPKWGLYRSLNDSTNLKDEQVLFADFSIDEVSDLTAIDIPLNDTHLLTFPKHTADQLFLADKIVNTSEYLFLYDIGGKLVLAEVIDSNRISISHLNSGLYFLGFMKDGLKTSMIKIVKQ